MLVPRSVRRLALTPLFVAGCAAAPPAAHVGVPFDEQLEWLVAIDACASVTNHLDPLATWRMAELAFARNPGADERACVIAAHGDCDRVFECFGVGRPTPHVPALDSDGCRNEPPRCEGDATLVFCWNAVDAVHAHVAVDQRFSAPPDELCENGAFVPRDPQPCTAPGTYCLDAHTVASCRDGRIARTYVCDEAETCVEDPLPRCRGNGPACTVDDAGNLPVAICDGEESVDCTPEQGARFDCASVGMHCATGPYGWTGCMEATDGCEAGDARCEGDALVVCAPDGRERRFDCPSHGYGGCSTGLELGWAGYAGATCVPANRWPWENEIWGL